MEVEEEGLGEVDDGEEEVGSKEEDGMKLSRLWLVEPGGGGERGMRI